MKLRGPALSFLLFVALACGRSEPPAADPAPTMPAIESSYVFGEGSSRGHLVVGVLLRWAEPEIIADSLPAGVFEQFLQQEAEIKAGGDELPEEPIEIEEIEPWREFESIAGRYAKAAAAASKTLDLEVLLREITLEQLDLVPVVITQDFPLGRIEETRLATYRSSGGITAVEPKAPALIAACEKALRSSPIINRWTIDPSVVVEAKRTDGQIRLQFAAAPTQAFLVDQTGKSLWTGGGDPTIRVPAPPDHSSLVTNRLVVTWRASDRELRRSWSLADLVGVIDREIVAASRAVVGGRVALRAHYHNSLTLLPASRQREEIRLVANGAVLATTVATSDSNGVLNASLLIPEGAEPGRMELDFGDAKVALDVRRDHRASIVTDRTLYHPTDTVHARVLVRHSPSGRPAANTQVGLTHKSVRGTRARRVVKTSEHGIASWSIALADAVAGTHAIRVVAGEATATASFTVEAFEKPLFTFRIEPDRLALRPGESAPVLMDAKFFNGAPMAGAEVRVRGAHGFALAPATGRADEDGRFAFTVTADGKATFGRGVLVVKNADGRTETRSIDLRLKSDGERRLRIRAAGDLVVAMPCRFEISGGKQGAALDCTLVGTDETRSVTLDDVGSGVVSFTLSQAGAVNIFAGREFNVGIAQPHMMRPDRRVATVGEALGLSFRGDDCLLGVDILRGNELLQTLTTRIRNGKGRSEIPLTAELAGVLTIHAYRIRAGVNWLHGTHVRVLVRRNNALIVSTQPDRDVYRPGDTARVDVTTIDPKGGGVPAALGYWAVDEAVLALKNWDSGYETVFDTLPSDAPRSLARAAESGDRGRIRAALGGISTQRFAHGVRVRNHRLPPLLHARDQLLDQLFSKCVSDLIEAYYGIYNEIPFRELRMCGSTRQQIAWLAENRYLDAALLLDPWGSPLVLHEDRHHGWIVWTSNGPDLRPDTVDDLSSSGHGWYGPPERILRFEALVSRALPDDHRFRLGSYIPQFRNASIGLGGGAFGGRRGRGGTRNLRAYGGAGYAPAPTRRDFPPTLVFVPEVLTGPDGHASLSIPLADSITTWRMRLVASSADGGTGVSETTLRVSQPLHLDPWLAPHLTDGDTLDLPVSVRNETDAAIRAKLRLEVTHHLRIVGDARAEIDVGARGTGAYTFRIRAVKPGKAQVRIETIAGSERDAVARIVTIRRDAREVVRTVSAQISCGGAWTPRFGRAEPGTLRLDLYPSPLADTVAGIDGLIREPHG